MELTITKVYSLQYTKFSYLQNCLLN